MKTTTGSKALIGLVLLYACVSYVAVQVVPVVAPVSAAIIPGTASPIGNAHSDGTAWLHDPAGGSPGLPEAD